MATTKKSLTARVVAGFGAVALATLTAFTGALPASAAANIEPGAPASITIHKHEQTGTTGATGTGSATDPVVGDAIPGVRFTIQEVTSLDVETNTTWRLLGGTDPLVAQDVIDAPGTYPLGADVGVNSWTVTTETDGSIRQNVPVGVYLVRELDAPASAGVVMPAQPFLVVVPQATAENTWNYNVHVFPKNTVTDVVKSVESFAQEGLGANVTWTVDAAVPVASEGNTLRSFVMQDTLDSRLTHPIAANNAVRVTVGATPLERDTHFEVTLDDTTVSIEFTTAGLDVLRDNADRRVVAQIDTIVTALETGTIANTASVVVNGTTVPSNTDSVYFGAIEIQKVDENGAALADAVFEVRDLAGQRVNINGEWEFRSNDQGVVSISGLRTNAAGTETYTIVETAAPAGYTLGATTSWTLQVPVGTTADAELTVVNVQVPAYALPITGGSGQTAFMIGGFGLLAGALGFMLMRRRKTKADAQA